MIEGIQGKRSMEEGSHKQSYIFSTRSFLYGFTIFIGAFLMFVLEPMAGKILLPHFGGSAGVWSAALLFFMTALLAGYVYVYFLSFARPGTQVIIQALLLLSALFLVILMALPEWQGSFFENIDITGSLPFFSIFKVLTVRIGLLFILLSTTSSLLQSWLALAAPRKTPYRLYALSNAGSLLALVAYPFLIEPHLSLSSQTNLWSYAFMLYGVCFFSCMALLAYYLRLPPSAHHSEIAAPETTTDGREKQNFSGRRVLSILALTALPSMHLVATTAAITQGVAAVPFFWLVPLALYLLSFVLCFSSSRIFNRTVWGALLFPGVIVSLVAWTGASSALPVMLVVFLYSGTLFFLSMLCHGELYRLRPPVSGLPGFYVLVALGGALGAAFGSIGAPLLFVRGMWEFPLGLFYGGVFALAAIASICRRAFGESARFFIYPALLGSLLVPLFSIIPAQYASNVIAASRNFYGLLTIREEVDKHSGAPVRFLVNGAIYHGSQFQSAALRRVPTTYYGEGSGAGVALRLHPRRSIGVPLSVGVVGLGAGTLAAYCEKGDAFRLYEINPAVIALARSHFSYLADCPGEVAVVEGDARLALEEEMKSRPDEHFDVLLIDAFTDDAIPTHLLTQEVFALYRQRVESSHGILAVHVSNKHLELAPLVGALAREAGWEAILVEAPGAPERGEVFSQWVLASSDATVLHHQRLASTTVPLQVWKAGEPLWSDDYSSIFQVLISF